MKQLIHVAQDAIRRNMKTGSNDPVIIVRKRGKAERHHRVNLVLDGKIVATFHYSQDKPLSCGARVWLQVAPSVDIVPV